MILGEFDKSLILTDWDYEKSQMLGLVWRLRRLISQFGNQLTGGGGGGGGGQAGHSFLSLSVSQCGADHGTEQRCAVRHSPASQSPCHNMNI